MKKINWIARAVAIATAVAAAGGPALASDDVFTRIKNLEGVWVAVDEKGQATDKVSSIFKVTSAGNSVQEIMFPGTSEEMVNMYYRDGENVRMTHYCAGGNQPTVKLVSSTRPGIVELEFVDVTNLASMNGEHMHQGQYQWVDDNHLKTEWRSFKDGKPSDVTRFDMVRRK